MYDKAQPEEWSCNRMRKVPLIKRTKKWVKLMKPIWHFFVICLQTIKASRHVILFLFWSQIHKATSNRAVFSWWITTFSWFTLCTRFKTWSLRTASVVYYLHLIQLADCRANTSVHLSILLNGSQESLRQFSAMKKKIPDAKCSFHCSIDFGQ